MTLAHIGGVPVEETVASLGPALLVAFGVAGTNLRARLRPLPRCSLPSAAEDHAGDLRATGRTEDPGGEPTPLAGSQGDRAAVEAARAVAAQALGEEPAAAVPAGVLRAGHPDAGDAVVEPAGDFPQAQDRPLAEGQLARDLA
jgi:hypothetical protein